MQKKSLNWFWALLFLGIIFRLIGNELNWPNFSPLMACTVVGAVYLPRIWNLILAPAVLIITELIFLPRNLASEGHVFSSWFLLSLAYYLVVACAALSLARHRSWLAFLLGSFLGSLGFYIVSNTFCWWDYQAAGLLSGYPPTWSGWWQANTVGLPGFAPTWTFLRNEILGDAVFVTVLLAAAEPRLLGLGERSRAAQQA